MCVAGMELLGAGASLIQGISANKAAKANAEVEEKRAEIESNRVRRELRRIQAENRVAAGASNIGPTGSFLDFMASNAVEGEVDALNTLIDGQNRAAAMRYEGRMAMTNGVLGAMSSMLGTQSSTYIGYK